MATTPRALVILVYLTCADQHSITVTRFPSIRNFALDGRVTVSGVEIRFSDPKLQPVHAIYGLRYASLGGEGNSMVSRTGTAESGELYHQAAKRRFMHSVAAFIYETPARGHLQKTGPPPECPQPRRVQPAHDTSFDEWTVRAASSTTSTHHLLQNPQPTTQAEDCLTLNVFVPGAAIDEKMKMCTILDNNTCDFSYIADNHCQSGAEDLNEHALPVLIFVHGDSYEHGSGNAYDFSLFSSLGSVIVVTLNYRLGVLGFLSENIAGSTRGNFALFDLQAAIQWVYSNIHRFGGDCEQMTLMGHSHGAALVHLFATSLLSIGPNYYGIKRLVLFDGSANAPWATSACDTDIKSLIEANFQMQQSSSASIFDLLQDLSITSILEIQRNLSRLGLERCFSPLPRKQQVVTVTPTLFNRVSLMYGQTEFAGSIFYQNAAIDDNVSKFMPALVYLLEHVFQVAAYPLTDLLKYVYVQSDTWTQNDNSSDEKNKIYEIFTDALFWTPGLATLRQHETEQEQSSEFSSAGSSRYVVHFSRAGYGDDLNLLLGAPFVSSLHLKSSMKRRLSQSLIQYATNFIHFGDPNKHFTIPNIAQNLAKSWPAFNSRDELSLKLFKPTVGLNEPLPPNDVLDVASAYRKRYTTFWMKIFPKIAASSRRTPQCKGRTITHFAVPEVQYGEAAMDGYAPVPPKSTEQVSLSERPSTIYNETVEFPSFYDTNRMAPLTTEDSKEGYNRIFLLTIVAGLSLFLINIVFTATFYFCHQQRKERSSGILISASEADHRENKNSQAAKLTSEMSSCYQSVVRLPSLSSAVEAPFQLATTKMQTDFQSVAFETLHRSPNQLGQIYPPGGNQATPMADHQIIAALDSSPKKETHMRPSARYNQANLGNGGWHYYR
ncbi:Neuroligin-3 [Echinococcus granulosus]|uniref:Neuroligin-3 n=1 Tax=Echinococcus granulosus TaxID=6210 RepID=W6VAQ5_ECHGR|nr:Neuroligin-3 [Echinococcus granulosus]EUB63864.1 Neuroligin-3 [Echinococcus granulosus]